MMSLIIIGIFNWIVWTRTGSTQKSSNKYVDCRTEYFLSTTNTCLKSGPSECES